MKQKNDIMKQNNDIIKQPMKNINTMKIMKKFLFLKIFFLALYSPTIFAITCSTGSGGGGSSSGPYSWNLQTSSATFSARSGHQSVVFDYDGSGDKMWVIGGVESDATNNDVTKNDVWHSTNGKDWTPVRVDGAAKGFSLRKNFSAVVHEGQMWVIGGGGRGNDGGGSRWINSVYSSTNGATWKLVRADSAAGGFPPRNGHSSVSHGDRMWVIGGYNPRGDFDYLNDVWSSTNGVTWEEETSNTGFIERHTHASVIYDNEMWVIAGSGFEKLGEIGFIKSYNDVWRSANGKDWTQKTSNSGFVGRKLAQAVVFDNEMWVIAGSSDSRLKEVWSSTDGATWDESTATVGFTARSAHSSIVFNNRIWVIGGESDSGKLNDVWSYSND